MPSPSQISRGESWSYEWRIEEQEQPIDAASDVEAWLSATYKGDPITPGSVVVLARGAPGNRSDGRVLWSGLLQASDVTTALVSILTGDPVFEVCSINGERKCQRGTMSHNDTLDGVPVVTYLHDR